MTNLVKLPVQDEDGNIHVVIETPRGAKAKLKCEPEMGVFVLSKSLMTGLPYPRDWGFIPSTEAEDGDPVDALVIHEAATFPGLVIKCKPVGVLEIMQHNKNKKKQRNDRVMAVPIQSHAESGLRVDDLSKQVKEELERFFAATEEFQSKRLEFLGWHGPKRAMRLITDSTKK